MMSWALSMLNLKKATCYICWFWSMLVPEPSIHRSFYCTNTVPGDPGNWIESMWALIRCMFGYLVDLNIWRYISMLRPYFHVDLSKCFLNYHIVPFQATWWRSCPETAYSRARPCYRPPDCPRPALSVCSPSGMSTVSCPTALLSWPLAPLMTPTTEESSGSRRERPLTTGRRQVWDLADSLWTFT